MLNINNLKSHQNFMVSLAVDNRGVGLFAEMGSGKTIAALTAMDELQNNRLEVNRWLVISTKRIVRSVWRQEAAQWAHTKHLRFSLIDGSQKDRKMALQAKADVYLISRDNVAWLKTLGQGAWWFDGVVIDESSSFKSHDSMRFKALSAALPAIKRIILMTGTPQPQNLLDLWSQLYLIDQGKRLGYNYHAFKNRYFEKHPYRQFVYEPKDLGDRSAEQEIADLIKDVCVSFKTADYIDLPPRIDRVVGVDLSTTTMNAYDTFEAKQILQLPNDEQISVVNAAAMVNKLLQFASGAVYDEDRNVHVQHDEKLDALDDLIDNHLEQGKRMLVFYNYKHSLARIVERLTKRKINFRVLSSGKQGDKDIEDWNNGLIDVFLLHPASAGHGLNLQRGGSTVIWYELVWQLELYQQGNARVLRQGQKDHVFIHHLIVKGTAEENVYNALIDKAESQEMLMQLVKAKLKKHIFVSN